MDDAETIQMPTLQEYLKEQYAGPPMTEEEARAEVQRHDEEWQRMQTSSSTTKPSGVAGDQGRSWQ